MSSPPTTPRAFRVDPKGAFWPGLIPLRPLGVGDIFGAAARLVRARPLLILLGFGGSLVGGGAMIGVLSAFADKAPYFSTRWLDEVMRGTRSTVPAAALWPMVVTGVFGAITLLVLSGVATGYAADDVLGAPAGRGKTGGSGTPGFSSPARLKARWPALLLTSAALGAAVFAGLVLLIIPGLLLIGAFLFAVPALIMERSSPGTALGRANTLGAGLRIRSISILLLATVISTAISTFVALMVPVPRTLGGLAVSELVAAVAAAVTTPWTASVIALLYIDARMRKENLAWSLVRAATGPAR